MKKSCGFLLREFVIAFFFLFVFEVSKGIVVVSPELMCSRTKHICVTFSNRKSLNSGKDYAGPFLYIDKLSTLFTPSSVITYVVDGLLLLAKGFSVRANWLWANRFRVKRPAPKKPVVAERRI